MNSENCAQARVRLVRRSLRAASVNVAHRVESPPMRYQQVAREGRIAWLAWGPFVSPEDNWATHPHLGATGSFQLQQTSFRRVRVGGWIEWADVLTVPPVEAAPATANIANQCQPSSKAIVNPVPF